MVGRIAILSWLLVIAGSVAVASSSQLIPFQGTLTDKDGTAIEGKRTLVFRIYDQPKGPANEVPLWQEVHYDVMIHEGHVNVRLGSQTPLDIEFGNPDGSAKNLYLGVTALSGTFSGQLSPYQEMQPRQLLVPAFFAVESDHSLDADKLGGIPAAEFATALELQATVAVLQAIHDQITTKIDALTGQAPDVLGWTGLCNGRVVRAGELRIDLQPVGSDRLVVEVNGEILANEGALEFDLANPDHIAEGTTFGADGFYYLYVENDAASLSPKVSSSPPDHGYSASARYVGEFYYHPTASGGDGVSMVDHDPSTGEYRILHEIPGDWVIELEDEFDGNENVFRTDNLLGDVIPDTASAVLLQLTLIAEDVVYYIGAAEMGGVNVYTDSTGHDDLEFFPVGGASVRSWTQVHRYSTGNEIFWLPISEGDATISYAFTRLQTAEDGAEDFIKFANLTVLGWRSLR